MKRLLIILFLCGLGIVAPAQNHLSVNGVFLGQNLNSVWESLNKSYSNSKVIWNAEKNLIEVKPAYLGNVKMEHATFHFKGGILSKSYFSKRYDGSLYSNYLEQGVGLYNQLVQQFTSKYGQPYVSNEQELGVDERQVSTWNIGSDKISIMISIWYPAYYGDSGDSMVSVTYSYGTGSYQDF